MDQPEGNSLEVPPDVTRDTKIAVQDSKFASWKEEISL